MQFLWNEETIQRFIDASEYTGFHIRLADEIRPHLDESDSFCDIGCGLGRIDLALSPWLSHITAADIDSRVINRLKADAAARGITNISGKCLDISEFDEVFDVVFMSFFGKSHSIQQYYKLCRKKMIRVVNAENKGNLYPSHHRRVKKDTIPIVKNELYRSGLSYKLKTFSAEFGQPLKSMDDAKSFVVQNAPDVSADELCDFLTENIQSTGDNDFPYYLPNKKEMGIFIIDMLGNGSLTGSIDEQSP